MQSFSELIKQKRLEKKLTMRGLENGLKESGVKNISRSYINLLEKNKKPPSYEAAYFLAKILEMDEKTAIHAAYNARIEHGYSRERRYLEGFFIENRITSMKIEDIVGAKKH